MGVSGELHTSAGSQIDVVALQGILHMSGTAVDVSTTGASTVNAAGQATINGNHVAMHARLGASAHALSVFAEALGDQDLESVLSQVMYK